MGRVELIENLFNTILSGNRIVIDEAQLWRPLQSQTPTHLSAKEWRRAVKGVCACRARRGIAQRGVVDACQLQIRADVRTRHGNEPEAGIVDVSHKQLR
jgi:hypothetical protein